MLNMGFISSILGQIMPSYSTTSGVLVSERENQMLQIGGGFEVKK